MSWRRLISASEAVIQSMARSITVVNGPATFFSGNEYEVATDTTVEFHDYVLEWDESEMRWYVDGVLYAMQNTWWTSASDFPAPFDQPFYILLNVAVGGNFPGAPNITTVFPVTMEVEYVRVYSGEL